MASGNSGDGGYGGGDRGYGGGGATATGRAGEVSSSDNVTTIKNDARVGRTFSIWEVRGNGGRRRDSSGNAGGGEGVATGGWIVEARGS